MLWSRSFTPAASQLASSAASPVNSLIRDSLIEGKTAEEHYEKDGYAVRWTFFNELELIFVVRPTLPSGLSRDQPYSLTPPILLGHRLQVAYQRILQLTYVDDLLVALKSVFVKLFEPFLRSFVTSLHAINAGKAVPAGTHMPWDFMQAFKDWDQVFDRLLKNFEDKAAQVRPTSNASPPFSLITLTKQERRSRNKPTVQRIIEDATPPSDDPSTSMSSSP